MQTHSIEELYTLPALARAWKVCESKLRKDAVRGILNVVRLGRAVRVTPAEAERYLRDGGRPAEPRR